MCWVSLEAGAKTEFSKPRISKGSMKEETGGGLGQISIVACSTVSVGNFEAGMLYQTLHSEAESLNLLSEGHGSSEAIDLEQEAPLSQSSFYRN